LQAFFERESGALERSTHRRVVDLDVLPFVPQVAELLERAVILLGDDRAELIELVVFDLRLSAEARRHLRLDGARRLLLFDPTVCGRRTDAEDAAEQDAADPGILAVLDDAATEVGGQGGWHGGVRSDGTTGCKGCRDVSSDQPHRRAL
jgi:hypothetical protein